MDVPLSMGNIGLFAQQPEHVDCRFGGYDTDTGSDDRRLVSRRSASCRRAVLNVSGTPNAPHDPSLGMVAAADGGRRKKIEAHPNG